MVTTSLVWIHYIPRKWNGYNAQELERTWILMTSIKATKKKHIKHMLQIWEDQRKTYAKLLGQIITKELFQVATEVHWTWKHWGTIRVLLDLKSQKLELQTRKKEEDNNKKELGDGGGVAKVWSYLLANLKIKTIQGFLQTVPKCQQNFGWCNKKVNTKSISSNIKLSLTFFDKFKNQPINCNKDTSVLFPFWALWCENSPPKKNPDGCSSIERTSILWTEVTKKRKQGL